MRFENKPYGAEELKKEIDSNSFKGIKEIFRSAMRTAEPLPPEYISGRRYSTTYYFIVEDNGVKCGTTWSPDHNSKMGKLVKISIKLMDLIVENNIVLIKFDKKYLRKINKLKLSFNKKLFRFS